MKIFTLMISLLFISSSPVYAGMFDALPKLPVEIPGLGGGDKADSSGLESTQSKLADRTNKVMGDFVGALEKFRGALDLDKDSSLKEKFANCGSGKICTDSADIERIESQAKEVEEKIEQMKKDGVKLSAGASKTFLEGLLPYGKGLLKSGVLGTDIAAFAPKVASAVQANPLKAPSQLAVAIFIVKQIPPILSTFGGANGGIYDYATYNGIEAPEDTGPE
jgi:hypothetical protein